jgi:hypothetical protein
MVLLLAVEPDARQATNLARVLRARPRTELVIAESAVRALQTLAGRVPDVLLTSALISRQDEVRLAAWLKDLGPAAAHVQELTIPLLATSAPPPKKRRGVLATLRRERTAAATPDGCDPDVFAEQVSGYMDRASAGRPLVEPEPPAVVEAAPAPVEIEPAIELLLLSPGLLPEPRANLAEPELVVQPDSEDLLPLVCAVEFAPEPLVELLLLPVGWLPDACATVAELEPVMAQDTEDLLPLVCAYEPQVQPAESLALAEAVVAEEEAWVPILIEDECGDPPAVVPDDVWVLDPVTGIDGLLEICVPASPVVAALSSPDPLPQPKPKVAATKKSAKSQPKPVQDEWGFFDPDQCGFAALLAKLDEITEQHDADDDAHSEDTTVRLLSY